MPYKSKKNQAEYQHRYHKFRKKKIKDLGNALNNGNLAKARRILQRKPKIHIKPLKKKRGRKK